ncbi:hypothetical protein MBLNU459_g8118t2 [Dothideomycetes sp. NU459]
MTSRGSHGPSMASALFALTELSYARIRKMGVRGLDIDDYLMLVAGCFYTSLIVTLNLTAQGGGSALALPGEDVFTLSKAEVNARIKGAKIDLVAEQSMLNVIWVLKACMLLLYNRLTMGLKQQLAVKAIAIYTGVGWLACQLAWFCECIPFKMYWQIAPSPPLNCMVLYDYLIVQAVFNISSDLFMLLIPLPLIMGVAVPMKQKLVLLIIFSMGIFVIVAAVLTKAEFFISIYSADYMFWYTREASVAVYVANLPCIWPLLREAMPVLKSWTPGFVSSSLYKTRRPGVNSTSAMTGNRGTRNNTARTFGMSRASMDEFHHIVEPAQGVMKTSAEPHVRELRTFAQKNRIEGGDASSQTSSEGTPIDGIRAETTIEMSVMSPAQDISDKGSDHSGNEYAWDVERGLPK